LDRQSHTLIIPQLERMCLRRLPQSSGFPCAAPQFLRAAKAGGFLGETL
jgi:hypothetical protein